MRSSDATPHNEGPSISSEDLQCYNIIIVVVVLNQSRSCYFAGVNKT